MCLLFVVYGCFLIITAELIVARETIWPVKLKILTIWPFTAKVGQPLHKTLWQVRSFNMPALKKD